MTEPLFTTIAFFNLPHETAVPMALLESEGIECFLPDESTVQVYNFYSNAIGGLRLQVKTEDAPRAIEILQKGGFLPSGNEEEKITSDENPSPGIGDSWKTDPEPVTDYVPADEPVLLHNEPEARKRSRLVPVLLLLVVILAAVSAYFFFAKRDGLEEKLEAYSWHIVSVTKNERGLSPYMDPRHFELKEPSQVAIFYPDGRFELQRPEGKIVKAHWTIQEKRLVLNSFTELGEIYADVYNVIWINENNISLEASSTSLLLEHNARR